jgi:prepilin-type N-terminal cleavage/methylation domain-containing protein
VKKRKRKRSSFKLQKGFTLLELLLSVAIFSLIVGIVGGAFRLSIRSWEKGEEEVEEFRKTRIVLDMVAQQIKSFYPYWIKKEKEWMIVFQGESKTLKLISPLSLRYPFITGLVLVEYSLGQDGDSDNGKSLVVREVRVVDDDSLEESLKRPKEEGSEIVLLSGLEDLTFEYYVFPPDSEEGEWQKSWIWEENKGSDEITFPQAVRITIKQKPRNPEKKEPLTTAMTVPLITAAFEKQVTIPFGSFPKPSLPPEIKKHPAGTISTPFGPLPGPSGGGRTEGYSTPFGILPAPPGSGGKGRQSTPFD